MTASDEDQGPASGFRLVTIRIPELATQELKYPLGYASILEGLARPFAEIAAAFHEQIRTGFSEQFRANMAPVFSAWGEQFARVASLNLSRLVPPDFVERLKSCMPPNWEDAGDLDYIAAALEIMNEGIPLVWVPRESIVGRLIRARDAASRAELLAHARLDIAEDCRVVLTEITAPALKPLLGLADEAVRTLRDGYCPAAQALAANVFDTWLRDVAKRGVAFNPVPESGFYVNIKRQIVPVSEHVSISELKASGVLAPTMPALQRFEHGGPALGHFTRHATAHGARPEHYTDANAVVAVMLMTSALRQSDASGW